MQLLVNFLMECDLSWDCYQNKEMENHRKGQPRFIISLTTMLLFLTGGCSHPPKVNTPCAPEKTSSPSMFGVALNGTTPKSAFSTINYIMKDCLVRTPGWDIEIERPSLQTVSRMINHYFQEPSSNILS